MPMEIQEFRLSAIWVETVLNLFQDPVPADAPMNFLGRRYTYVPEFNLAQTRMRAALAGVWEVPWPKSTGQRFWQSYLEGRVPGEVRGEQAWKALVPFRVRPQFSIPEASASFSSEAFYYPHGFGWIFTARVQGKLSLPDAVETAFRIRRTAKVDVQWQGGTVEKLALEELADQALTQLRQIGFGPKASQGQRIAIDPFTVFTVIRASGADPDVPVEPKGEIQRALEAVSSWRPTWKKDVLPELATSILETRTAPPSHILYARKRGRAIWFPVLFDPKQTDIHSLACYHRNLALASLQVESLCGLLQVTEEQQKQQLQLSAVHQECARLASGVLGRLYGGHKSTYRSWSPRAQIEHHGLVSVLNGMRLSLGMSPLS